MVIDSYKQLAIKNSLSALGIESINATRGVHQGGSTSCSLFTLLIDYTIEKIRELGDDGWLRALHILLLMDDTALLATCRARMQKKLRVLYLAAGVIGMDIHRVKSLCLVINSDDTSPFVIEDITVGITDKYVYLGSPILDACISRQVAEHIASKLSHLLKLSSFCQKNADAPFPIKKTVWNSAIQSAVFYRCETWLTKQLHSLSRPYLCSIKEMLGSVLH